MQQQRRLPLLLRMQQVYQVLAVALCRGCCCCSRRSKCSSSSNRQCTKLFYRCAIPAATAVLAPFSLLLPKLEQQTQQRLQRVLLQQKLLLEQQLLQQKLQDCGAAGSAFAAEADQT